MPYKINAREIEAVQALSPAQRYGHFVRRVADWEEVWSLANGDGWVLMADDEGHELIPVWPHPHYAEALAIGDWAGHQPKPIPLADFLEKWLPGMARDGRRLAVFATREGKGIIVNPLRFKSDLEEACEQYE